MSGTSARIDALRHAAVTPLVSVLLASRDGARYLQESLDSLAAQRYPEVEIVAVDDGSTDATPEILARFAARHGRTRVLRAEGEGLAAALHRAAGEASGTFFARQDDDDRSDPERFAKQVRFLHLHPEVGVVGTSATRIDASGSTLGPYRVPLEVRQIAAALRHSSPFVHGSVMMRREAYERSGGYRAAFRAAQDVDLWLRMPPGAGLANLPEPLYAWREHPGGVFARARDQQLFYASVARAFLEERAAGNAGDSVALLERAETSEWFLEKYPLADRVKLHWGKLLVRLGRTAEARELLRAAGHSRRSTMESLLWRALGRAVTLSPRGFRARDRARRRAEDPGSVTPPPSVPPS